ncbi:DNA-directed RNA polymerase subunit beta [Caldithrix abyssi DSM 13497]|uniref:DNA-directed RNA polymerase subunit beta n=1 Tax=Caldithrix abyssi DSM 13497 TaxID=880073 RepID=H1XVH1_CALAY|nr:DNA-directed RNA polymerase subunit beta [Caldithrix abyssi]APF17646.1 rpoB DNA-directed RNA polymerase subunit beta [Caldithrix abyssi DSM 13497]EHO41729.1 DNA-directed RNA polymerase subunit beta [Caldithrix abyssi DSM 13497]
MKGKKKIKRHSFARIPQVIEYPNLLDIQLKSFEDFLQDTVPPDKRKNQGLQAVFNSVFPISDSAGNYELQFVEYYVDKPKYSERECQERGVSYSVPLKARMRLAIKDVTGETENFTEFIEQDVYLGNMPHMTSRGTFIINGAERVIVSQLHRSPGVFFSDTLHPNGTPIYSARIIPFRGSWVEFTTDVNDVMFVYIDRKKKFPVTMLLRAIGFSTVEDIVNAFDEAEEVTIELDKFPYLIGQMLAADVVDTTTGEIIAEQGRDVSQELLEQCLELGIKTVKIVRPSDINNPNLVLNTLKKDSAKNEAEAIEAIYRQLRSGEPPDIDTARALIERMFFNEKRYDLGAVGRYRINKKLNLDIPYDVTVLTREDIIAILKYLIGMRLGVNPSDDIDHLGNRRVRTVGEQLAAQFSVGFARMARTIKERMNIGDAEKLTPQDLVNARTISSVINTFFGTSQLSQFMDQTNPLAELTHKRRLSALGPGGLTRERAGFEVRDVHYTHYGRLCPIETPEGPNIGLISSLCVHARINEFGFIETPYRKVENGKVTDEIQYLSATEEDGFTIAQVNAPIDEKGNFLNDRVKARRKGDFPVVAPEEVEYMDVATNQIVSPAASLIPFLEHDDANRALMGSNMQRQAVPLLVPESPIVGTGMEEKVARDSGTLVIAEEDGVVEYVDAEKIVVKMDNPPQPKTGKERLLDLNDRKEYRLLKFIRTNQDTVINQRPLVEAGQKVKKGDILADGCATDQGELALGRNVLVAFMPWHGYNFEDAIIISDRIVRDDVYTSIHIQEFELQVRDTKRGEEELTREIPNVSEEATKDLDENGIIRVGAEVHAGDILIGKVTPKGETDPTPEEKLLKAIFGNKAGDVKDASLKAPPGMHGVVVATRLFSRKKKNSQNKKDEKKLIEKIEQEAEKKKKAVEKKLAQRLGEHFKGMTTVGIRYVDGKSALKANTKITETTFNKLDVKSLDINSTWFEEDPKNTFVRELYSDYRKVLQDIDNDVKREKHKLVVGDELPPGITQLAKVYVAEKRKLSVGDKMAGRHGNKGVISRIVPMEDMPFLEDGTPVDIVLNPLGVPSRMNLGQIFETTLGWAGYKLDKKYATPVFDGANYEEIIKEIEEAGLPKSGKVTLYDGRTGETFHQPVTVGQIYMLKLSHLVDDKIHARSIGPYSLITQQPLGGKAQFGGQRFGEMEVWALEAYGAAYTLQEILTVKSDDVTGRSKTYEAIVKGENLPDPGIPESFNVLVRELQGLALKVRLE